MNDKDSEYIGREAVLINTLLHPGLAGSKVTVIKDHGDSNGNYRFTVRFADGHEMPAAELELIWVKTQI